jgi:hypothetical protein
MMPNVQSVYVENSQINVTVTLTAHHKGHFVFKGCVIEDTMTIPTQQCFDSHPLKFVQDLYYNAPVDVNHPERVYVAPSTVSNRVYPTEKEFKDGMLFKFTLELPQGLVGELVLLQWYYVASNSGCNHEGYDVYPFPREWIYASLDEEEEESSAWEEKWSVGTGLKSCKDVLPEDGVSKVCCCVCAWLMLELRVFLSEIDRYLILCSLYCVLSSISCVHLKHTTYS